MATSEACSNQAFVVRERVVGLQFHIEYSRASIETMLRECGEDLRPGPFVQTPEEILADESRPAALPERLFQFLDALFG